MKSINSRSITFKIVISSALVSLLLVVITVVKAYIDTGEIIAEIEKQMDSVMLDIIQRRGNANYDILSSTVSQIKANEKLIEAFANGDREEVAKITLPTMEALSESGIGLFYFHLPDNKTFFRVHNPEQYGDDLSILRRSVIEVNTHKRPVSSMDFGLAGLAYRYIALKGQMGGVLHALALQTAAPEN